jgi:hypothetical protein
MPDWSLVRAEHVRAAMAECDRLGSREFLARNHFGRGHAWTMWDHGTEYDPSAILGVAYLHATGTAATRDDLRYDLDAASRVLSGLGFDVVVDEEAVALRPAPRKAAAKKVTVPRAAAAPRAPAVKAAPRKVVPATRRPTTSPEPVAKICPTCYMALPATGICDTCD